MTDQQPSIGIDFGTTNSSVAWFNPRTGQAETILNAEGETKTPSLVYFGEHETLVGKPVDLMFEDISADRALREDFFQRTVMSIKRDLLPPNRRISLPDGRFVRPVEVAAEILKKLRRDAEDLHFHEGVSRAVITCPAEFSAILRRVIGEAGRLAGFEEVVTFDEPVAGALAYSQEGLKVGKHVLVYDLGGGTFDLAVLDNEDESFYPALEPKGMDRCGGDDFDQALYAHCDELARRDLNRPISLSGAIDLEFLRQCRRRKEDLTYQERRMFSSYLAADGGSVRFQHEIDRQTFEDLILPYIETTTQLTDALIKEAEAAGHEVDTVVLVGGSSSVPLVWRMLEETLPVDPLKFAKKDVAVALGAAYYTNVLWPPPDYGRGDEVLDPTPLDNYKEALEAVRGGKLDKVEVDRLEAFAGQLGLSKDQARDVERRVLGNTKEGVLSQRYRDAVEMIWADGELNRLEVEWLGEFAHGLGLGQTQAAHFEREIMGATGEEILRRTPKPEPQGRRGDFRPLFTLTGHSDVVHSVAFLPDGRFLASSSSDLTVRGWNSLTGQPAGTLSENPGRVRSVAISPNGQLLASGGFDKAVRVFRLPNGEPFRTMDHGDWVFSVTFSPDNRLLGTSGADGEVKLWDVESGQMVRGLSGHTHWVLSASISPDGEYLASASADGTARVWDLKTGRSLRVLAGHTGWVWSVAFGPEGDVLASAGEDGEIRTWDPKTGASLGTLPGHSGTVFSVALGPDGRLLASAGADRKVRLWDPQTGELLNVLSGHEGAVEALAISPDGKFIASGGHDRTVRGWEREAGPAAGGAASQEDLPGQPANVEGGIKGDAGEATPQEPGERRPNTPRPGTLPDEPRPTFERPQTLPD